MKHFEVSCAGRAVGAIGRSSWIRTHIVAENEDAARLKMYEHYEHLSGFQTKEVECGEHCPGNFPEKNR